MAENMLTVIDKDTICISLNEYRDLLKKAERFGLICEHVNSLRLKVNESYGMSVDNDFIFSIVTGCDKEACRKMWINEKIRKQSDKEAVEEGADE